MTATPRFPCRTIFRGTGPCTGTVSAEIHEFDRDAICNKCLDRAHMDFIRRMKERGIAMSCVEGCPCRTI